MLGLFRFVVSLLASEGWGLERQSDRIPLHRPHSKASAEMLGLFRFVLSLFASKGWGLERQSDRIPLHRPHSEGHSLLIHCQNNASRALDWISCGISDLVLETLLIGNGTIG